MPFLRLLILLPLTVTSACADFEETVGNPVVESRLEYLANEGVAVFHGHTTLLFDPLFRNDYGLYALVPETTRNAMFNALPPFENVTAIFVSHYHGDHFDPSDMLRLLDKHGSAKLYAPRQAVDALMKLRDDDMAVFERVTAIDLAYGDAPLAIERGDIRIDAFYVPHSGWPNARTDVQNIAFRVTVDGHASVAHLGDADPNLLHFEPHKHEWREHQTDVALPPYWFFNSTYGNNVLGDVIQPGRSIGIHVPAAYSRRESIPANLRGFDLFIDPGETRPLVSEAQ